MYEHQSGEFVCGYWAINLRVNLFQHFNTSACAISFFLSWLNPLYNNLMMSSELICPSIRKSVLVYAFLALITAFGDPLALSTPRQQLPHCPRQQLLPFSSLRSPSYSSFCCPPSWKVQQFWQSAIFYSIRNPGHKITFSQCSTNVALHKSIVVIIMCSRPS